MDLIQPYGLIGEHLSHSDSPEIHALFGNNEYACFSLNRNRIAEFLSNQWLKGVNITIPYKRVVLPLCDFVSETVQLTGSVNTMVRSTSGQWFGYNTDAFGLRYALANAGLHFRDEKVWILGNGGVSQTVQAVARADGAASVTVVSRSGPVTYDAIWKKCEATLLIQATPVGMSPHSEGSLVDLKCFPFLRGVVELIYNPIRSNLLLQASDFHIKYTNGYSMLVAQAKQAEELFFQTQIPNSKIASAGRIITKMRENLVLIGMPGAGKTTIGRTLSAIADRPFVDIDEKIVQMDGRTIERIFAEEGEDGFRALETRAIRDVCRSRGQIIATGGGAVLSPANCAEMRRNGRIYEIFRPLSMLPLDGRPVSQRDGLATIYEQRKQLYDKTAQKKIQNTQSPEVVAREIWREFCENTCLEWAELEPAWDS